MSQLIAGEYDVTLNGVQVHYTVRGTSPASSGGGNTKIETTVALPQPCIAPIVFVTSPGGAWFAATGN